MSKNIISLPSHIDVGRVPTSPSMMHIQWVRPLARLLPWVDSCTISREDLSAMRERLRNVTTRGAKMRLISGKLHDYVEQGILARKITHSVDALEILETGTGWYAQIVLIERILQDTIDNLKSSLAARILSSNQVTYYHARDRLLIVLNRQDAIRLINSSSVYLSEAEVAYLERYAWQPSSSSSSP